MAEIKSWKCDECGVQKMESNHWILGFLTFGRYRNPEFRPWDDKMAAEEAVTHLCGEGCATKVLSRQIQAWRAQ